MSPARPGVTLLQPAATLLPGDVIDMLEPVEVIYRAAEHVAVLVRTRFAGGQVRRFANGEHVCFFRPSVVGEAVRQEF